jgi:hypothetical protein
MSPTSYRTAPPRIIFLYRQITEYPFVTQKSNRENTGRRDARGAGTSQ